MNVIGAKTLLEKEVRRFLRVPGQTVLQPLISTTLYFVVFGYTLGGLQQDVDGVSYVSFIVPGLVFLGIANNAFLNASSSFFITKIQGTIVDLLVAPLGPTELLIGFVAGAMVRGLLVGLLTWAAALVFTGAHLVHPLTTLLFLGLSAYVFSVLGLVAGIWTRDGSRQFRMARRVHSGQVFINNYGAAGGVELPFGGVKSSGYGREKGLEALYGFTTLKTVAIQHG